jgi:hypothetical protein
MGRCFLKPLQIRGLWMLALCSVSIPMYGSTQITPPSYWQIQVHYTMSVRLDTSQHTLSGSQKLSLHNTSPDTLRELYYHLYYNAFQPGSAMDVRSRTLPDPDRRVGSRIQGLKPNEQGFQRILSIQHERSPINDFQVEGTVLHVPLIKPILPGQKTTIDLQFEAQIPVQIRRTGRHNA